MEAAAPTARGEGEGAGAGGHQRPWRMAAELPEADLERMAALRSGLRESRAQREQRAEQQRQKDREMVEAWKARREEEAARLKEERRERLQRLQACKTPRANPEDLGDQEYRELMAKHGSKLRSPRAPPGLETAGSSQVTSAGGLLSSRSLEESVPSVPPPPRKPPVPPAPGPRRPVGGLATQAAEAALIARSPAATAGSRRMSGVPEGPVGPGRGSVTSGSGGLVGALPPVSPGRGPGMGVGEHEAASLGLGASGALALAAEDGGGPVLGPHRSLMPKKDRLRKKQQELMKKTDVVFYRHHMRRHFQRILEAVELTFSDTSRKKKANMNLSKPLTAAELRNLAPAGVRQP